MTAGALTVTTQIAHFWASAVGTVVYDYQTLIAGLLAIGAAYYAARPVWRQLRDSNLQTQIQHRETLASLMRESQDRFARASASIAEPMLDLQRLTNDHQGEPIAINTHAAFELDQRIHGKLDWYLVDLKTTENEPIEEAKARLKLALDDRLRTLNDVHWSDHNDQYGDDYAIADDEWAAILVRSKEAETLTAEKAAAARQAIRALEAAQARWITGLRVRIGKLDLAIAAAS